jgi:protein ImuB
MLQLELNGRPPVAPVLRVRIEAEPVKPSRTQHGLFLPASPEPQKLEVTVARVKHLVGAGRVGTPELRDTHRPDSFALRQFAPGLALLSRDREGAVPKLCLRRYRPPRVVQVLMVNHQPVRLFSASVTGRVVMARGPWRTSGEWWREDAWNHDEWDIALDTGSLYRVYCDIDTNRWFLEGAYD